MSEFCLPDHILREPDLPEALPRLAHSIGLENVPPVGQTSDPYLDRLTQIYSPHLDKLCRDAYPRDYMMFGFSDFDTKNPA
jgi:hypothetical protein